MSFLACTRKTPTGTKSRHAVIDNSTTFVARCAQYRRWLLTLCRCCSRLGLSREASFEEVQDSRNYLYEVCPTSCPTISLSDAVEKRACSVLVLHIWCMMLSSLQMCKEQRHLCSEDMTEQAGCMQTYKRHERSREAIELAYDSILQERMKVRHKYGFQPPRRGRKSDLQGDPLVNSHFLPARLIRVNECVCRCTFAGKVAVFLVVALRSSASVG